MNENILFFIMLILFIINELVYFIIEILNLVFSICTTKEVKNYFYFYFTFSCIRFIQIILVIVTSIYDKWKKVFNIMIYMFCLLFIFSFLFWIIHLIIITFNFNKFKLYYKNCPYTIRDLEYSLHIQRRCELYNIYNNSRYSFQYICSYDSSKDFNNKLEYEMEPNNVICIPFKNLIENNNQINIFLNEYKNEEKFYCSRTDNPDKYNYATSKDCNEKKYKYMLAFIILDYLRILFNIWPFFVICIKTEDDNNFNPFRGNILNISRKTTNISEISNRIENFVKQRTKNIIIENKKEFSIDVDIKNLELKNKIDKIKSNKDEQKIQTVLNSIDSNTKL